MVLRIGIIIKKKKFHFRGNKIKDFSHRFDLFVTISEFFFRCNNSNVKLKFNLSIK